MYTCYKCGAVKLSESDKCPNCALAMMNAEAIDNAITKKLMVDAYIAQQKNQNDLMIANKKMEHSLRIENEKEMTNEQAHKNGTQMLFEDGPIWYNKHPFHLDVNESGVIQARYTPPYLLDRLNEAFRKGVIERIKEEVGETRIVDDEENIWGSFAQQVFDLGIKNVRKFRLLAGRHPFFSFCTYEYESEVYAVLDKNSQKYIIKGKYDDLPFYHQELCDAYWAGLNKYIESENEPYKLNTRLKVVFDALQKKRQQEEEESKQTKILIATVLLLLAGIFFIVRKMIS